jgi:hypothetical protein
MTWRRNACIQKHINCLSISLWTVKTTRDKYIGQIVLLDIYFIQFYYVRRHMGLSKRARDKRASQKGPLKKGLDIWAL